MRDDDRIPIARRRPRQEPLSLFLHEVRVVGDQDARGRIKHQELARNLREAMVGHRDHRLVGQAEAALLHHGGTQAEGFARPDRMGDIGRTRSDDPPDDALLVIAHPDRGRCARQLQMLAVEAPGHEIVVGVVVNAHEPVGAFAVLPDPGLESRLDLRKLLFRGFGIRDVEFAAL